MGSGTEDAVTSSLLVDIGHVGGRSVLRLAGELDLCSMPKLLDGGARVLSLGEPGPLVVDLADVAFCDSSGLRGLSLLREQAETYGRTLVLRSPQRVVRRVLELTDNIEYFAVEPAT
jgi:anti-anti-sigma factor